VPSESPPPQFDDDANSPVDAAQAAKLIAAICQNVERALRGKPEIVRRAVETLLAGGHLLLEDVPGVGKTTLAQALARSIDGSFSRIQFTSDLLPSDVLGASVPETRGGVPTGGFAFQPGPIFANVVLADEVNRATPKAQSALLEAMEEHQVTTEGETRPLPEPFFVIATQNPLEQVGTFPLPESQLDRFLMQIDVLYPDRDAERRMLFETTGASEATAETVLDADTLRTIQQFVRRMPVGESVVEAILNLVRLARPAEGGDARFSNAIAWGPGPRASQSLMLACRARALIDGRYAPSVDDVVELAEPVLQHRMALGFAARADGLSVRSVVSELKAKIG